jgi:hypothetical protein
MFKGRRIQFIIDPVEKAGVRNASKGNMAPEANMWDGDLSLKKK